MSSRNVRLTPEDRAAAPVLNRALEQAEAIAMAGGTVDDLREAIIATIEREPRATLTGLDFVDPATFAPVSGPVSGPIGIMLSAQFGEVLLIDQREITP
jgi:pantoate--beta-alanine ligase